MDDVPRGQEVTGSDFRVARRAAAELSALGKQSRPRRAVDCAVHAAATQQGLIGGVDDRVDRERRDIRLSCVDLHRRILAAKSR